MHPNDGRVVSNFITQALKNEPITIDASNAEKELVFMELNKNILENMYLLCNEVYMPVMSNPLNMAGWSDLVSKDLMDKFHGFLAHLYVTIGLVNRKTLLPLPPNDVTSSEKTSSKDKSEARPTCIVLRAAQLTVRAVALVG